MQVCAVAAVAAHWVLAGGSLGGVGVRVKEAVLAIVGGAFLGVAEDVVGGGYSGEALAGFWVGAVAVWVVAKGEGVELSVVVYLNVLARGVSSLRSYGSG